MPAANPLPYADQHDTTKELADARARFEKVFGPGGTIRAVRSPGRVNLIGEHTDYNDGFVLPMAIEPHVLVVFRERTDGVVRLSTTMYTNLIAEFSLAGLKAELDLIENPASTEPKPPTAWYDYSKGMAAMIAKAGGDQLKGMDALLNSTIPSGGGLSSSAALEVGTGLALMTLAGRSVADDDAKMALGVRGQGGRERVRRHAVRDHGPGHRRPRPGRVGHAPGLPVEPADVHPHRQRSRPRRDRQQHGQARVGRRRVQGPARPAASRRSRSSRNSSPTPTSRPSAT